MLEIISQLESIDISLVKKLALEIEQANIDWGTPFSGYTSDGAKFLTLMNSTGEDSNFDYSDSLTSSKTPLLRRLPFLDTLLSQSGFQIMSVYLNLLDSSAFLHEHRDFVNQTIPRLRLHIPIITNDQAFLVIPGKRLHLKEGFIWKFDPRTTVHSAHNVGSATRIHLLIDCYLNDKLSKCLEDEWFDETAAISLPVLNPAEKEKLLQKTQLLLDINKVKEAEETLLRSFCEYFLDNVTSYDLLIELFERDPLHKEKAEFWKQRRHEEVYLELQPLQTIIGDKN